MANYIKIIFDILLLYVDVLASTMYDGVHVDGQANMVGRCLLVNIKKYKINQNL